MPHSGEWVQIFAYLGAASLILLGMFALVYYRNLIRVILGISLLDGGINLFIITIGYKPGGVAPILINGVAPAGVMVDPVPQALVLTAIVIGVGVQALALALAIQAHRSSGTLDTQELARRIAEENGTRVVDGIPASMEKQA
jgi:multicomponent Na+:H+ antiporter subunit C